jgi:hypothetical protein
MPLDPQQREDLAKAVAAHIPPFILDEVVAPLQTGLDLPQLRGMGPAAPDENARFVAREVVARVDDLNLARSLARALYRKALLDDGFVGKIVPFMEDPNAAQQGAIAVRANTLSSRELRTFLDRTESKLCVVAATQAGGTCKQGTGFLVGADLVLTAHHVLAEHIARKAQGLPAVGQVRLFFDHYDGDPIADPAPPRAKARPVELHRDWLVASSDALPRDGLLTPEQEALVAEAARANLDFALIRLAEKIGSETRSSAGGERRSWIDLRELGSSPPNDERIIIPQHPHGHPQRIDFGRLSSLLTGRDPSNTRIRYNTESEKGTSGAPCFNRNFQPVGLHNASYEPHGETIANQAIRLERIVELIGNHLPAPAAPASGTPIWKVKPIDGPEHGLFGRDILLDWLDLAVESAPGKRSERVYAAVGATRNSGKTFSIDILREHRRQSSDRIVVLGTNAGLIPRDVVDVIRAITAELRIPQSDLADMPPRPSAVLPSESQDGDKLAKWTSEEIPAWFDALLRRNREIKVDVREEARTLRAALRQQDFPVPAEVDATADEPLPREETRYLWDRVWIALDRLGEEDVSPEVKDLIVGLTGGKLEEAAVAPELRRLRWLLLGDALGFSTAAATIEPLDPLEIGWSEVADCVKHLYSSVGMELEGVQLRVFEPFFRVALRDDEKAEFDVSETRLKTLKNVFARVEPQIREVFG